MPDASVMVEVLRRTRLGIALAPRLVTADLVAPDLLDVEVGAALRRAVLQGITNQEDAIAQLRVLRAWPIRRVPNRDVLVPSQTYWRNVTAYDAVYVAVADAAQATLLTADGPLSRTPVADVAIENVIE